MSCADCDCVRVGEEVIVNMASQLCREGEEAAMRVVAIVPRSHVARVFVNAAGVKVAGRREYLFQATTKCETSREEAKRVQSVYCAGVWLERVRSSLIESRSGEP